MTGRHATCLHTGTFQQTVSSTQFHHALGAEQTTWAQHCTQCQGNSVLESFLQEPPGPLELGLKLPGLGSATSFFTRPCVARNDKRPWTKQQQSGSQGPQCQNVKITHNSSLRLQRGSSLTHRRNPSHSKIHK